MAKFNTVSKNNIDKIESKVEDFVSIVHCDKCPFDKMCNSLIKVEGNNLCDLLLRSASRYRNMVDNLEKISIKDLSQLRAYRKYLYDETYKELLNDYEHNPNNRDEVLEKAEQLVMVAMYYERDTK